MSYKEIEKRLDRIEDKIDKMYDTLFNGEGKIAGLRASVSYLKWALGGICGLVATLAIIMIERGG